MNEAETITRIINWICGHAEYAMAEPLQPEVNKAGIIALHKTDKTYEILLIKPHPKKKNLAPPSWQLVKGTRMILHKSGELEDYELSEKKPKGDLEPLLCTALREGIEESGLILENINRTLPLGCHKYRSVTTGKSRYMQLYALLLKNKKQFDWPGEASKVTEDMAWFPISKLPDDIRDDAKEIIENLKSTLDSI